MGLEPTTSAVTGRRSNQLNYQAEYPRPAEINGGNNRARTYDPLLVRQMLSQLSYAPTLSLRDIPLSDEIYYTTFARICQAFFQTFLKLFCCFFDKRLYFVGSKDIFLIAEMTFDLCFRVVRHIEKLVPACAYEGGFYLFS